MGCKMCSDLKWKPHVEALEVTSFSKRIKKEWKPGFGSNLPPWVSTAATVLTTLASAALLPLAADVVWPSTTVFQSFQSHIFSYPPPPHFSTTSPASSDECLSPRPEIPSIHATTESIIQPISSLRVNI